MIQNIIYDIGINHALNSEFYLNKGFNAFAVEANSEMCARAEERLMPFLKSQRLKIINVGIYSEPGEFDFYVSHDHDDWISFAESAGWRSGVGEKIRVQTVRSNKSSENTAYPII